MVTSELIAVALRFFWPFTPLTSVMNFFFMVSERLVNCLIGHLPNERCSWTNRVLQAPRFHLHPFADFDVKILLNTSNEFPQKLHFACVSRSGVVIIATRPPSHASSDG